MAEASIRQFKQFSHIGGVSRDPDSREYGKFVQFNSNNKFEYVKVGDGGDSDINTTYFTNFVNNLLEGNTDEYLKSFSRVSNTARLTYNIGTTPLDIPLGALAWEDSVEATLDLPGDSKVLFDDGDTLGGEDAFKYSKSLNMVQFQGTELTFDLTGGTEGVYKRGIKYLGNYSWSFGHGDSTSALGSYNLLSGFRAGNGLGASSSKNIISGYEAGYQTASTITGSIFIGSYAGKYETASNKLFLDNVDYLNPTDARNGSFLYADLDSERRLYIRDSLAVSKEGKFGYSGLNDASGEYGMYQMSAASGGQPQWHDGSVWQNFANTTDTYLDTTSFDGTNITFTLSDATVLPTLDISSVNTITFATSPSSPATGKVTSDYGYLQISNSSFDDNEGITYKDGLFWDNSNTEFNVPGAIKLSTESQYTASDGVIINDGSHFYGRLGGVWIQLDNVVGTGEANTASNVGAGGIGIFKQKTSYDLEFKSINTGDSRVTITDDTSNNEIDVALSLAPAGNNIAASSGLTYSGDVFSSITGATGTTPTYNFNTIVSNTVSIDSTSVAGELRLEVTGTGGGEANTGTNLGTGVAIYKNTTTPTLNFKTISAIGNHVTTSANADGLHVDIDVADLLITDATSTSGESLFNSIGTFGFELFGLRVNTTSGLTLVNTTEDLLIDQTIPIPYFKETTSGIFDRNNTGSTSTNIIQNLEYSDDIRNGISTANTRIFELNVGDGLIYNTATNTLSSNVSGGGATTDYRLTSIDDDSDASDYIFTFNVEDGLGNPDSGGPYTVSFPKEAASVNKATYTDNVSPAVGGILVDKSIKSWNGTNTTQQLTLDELTGTLSIAPELVAYSAQNALLNEDNDGWVSSSVIGSINTKRVQARSNIGAAYAQGDSSIDFYADSSTAETKFYCDTVSTDEAQSDVSRIQALLFRGPHLTSTTANGGVYVSKRPNTSVDRTEVGVLNGQITFKVNNDQGAGTVTFYKSNDSGSVSKIMELDSDGNLYVKGNIYAGQDINAFNSTAQNM